MSAKGQDISDRLISFAGRILRFAAALPDDPAGRHVASQVIRCGTSAGANYEEARGAESRRDFMHKLRIASKELQEARYWIRLVIEAGWVRAGRADALLKETEELNRIFGKSISTAKGNGIKPNSPESKDRSQ